MRTGPIPLILFALSLSAAAVFGGPNQNARILLDLEPATTIADTAGTLEQGTLAVAVTAADVINLDSYEFHLRFDPLVLEYSAGLEDAPLSGITNILKTRGGSTIGFQSGFLAGSDNTLYIANTLVSDDSIQAPEGDGVLAVILFNVLQVQPCTLWVENAVFVDYELEQDLLTNYTNGLLTPGQTPVFDPPASPSLPVCGTHPTGMRFLYNAKGQKIGSVSPWETTSRSIVRVERHDGRFRSSGFYLTR